MCYRIRRNLPIDDVPILIRTGLERLGGVGPDAVLVFGHVEDRRHMNREIAAHLHLLGVWRTQAEGDSMVIADLRRDDAAARNAVFNTAAAARSAGLSRLGPSVRR